LLFARQRFGEMTGQPAPEKRRGLGRGLEVLVGGVGDSPELAQLPVDSVHPNPRQPRRRFEPEAGSGLARSIEAQGLLQPVVVRARAAGGYELIAGERRWRAAKEAGLARVPALVREADDSESLLLSLVENVAREQLTAVEEARAYAVLMDEFGLAVGEIAERVARSASSVSNRLRLLELPDDILWMLARGELTEGHARAVLAAPGQAERRRLAKRVVKEGLSVRATERAARAMGARTYRTRSRSVDPALAERAARAFQRLTGFRPKVTPTRVEIPFADERELAELAEALERLAS
jgi:ParB family transcriptional regulator, chromosome partitioning protein